MIYFEEVFLTQERISDIEALERRCAQYEAVQFKLELMYKAAAGDFEKKSNTESASKAFPLEFYAYDGERLVGYLGISSYDNKPELNGLVDPIYRRQGVFSSLWKNALAVLKKQGYKSVLLLCDSRSISGIGWIETQAVKLHHSEFEMKRSTQLIPITDDYTRPELCFRKGINADAKEIQFQNSIYFGASMDNVPLILPEEESARGMDLFLICRDQEIVGKIHLQTESETGWVYGLGVKPEYRGLGYGRAALIWAVHQFSNMNLKTVGLQVESENENALSLYLRSGFEMCYKMDYYEYFIA